MARRTSKSIVGSVSGKVGPVVFLTVSGQDLVRARPSAKRKEDTPKLAKQKEIFKAIMFFFKYYTAEVFNLGYQVKKSDHISPFNAAISYHLLNAVVELDGKYGLDLTKLKFSKPIRLTQVAWHAELIRINDKEVQANWELNPCPLKTTQLNDKVIIIFYHKNHSTFMHRYALRSELSYTLELRNAVIGDEIFCWIFLTSADGKLASQTQFLGSV